MMWIRSASLMAITTSDGSVHRGKAMNGSRRSALVTLRGAVVETCWDDIEQTMRIAILTREDDLFEVVPDKAGRRLADYVGSYVDATGWIGCHPHAEQEFSVLSTRIVDEPSEATTRPSLR